MSHVEGSLSHLEGGLLIWSVAELCRSLLSHMRQLAWSCRKVLSHRGTGLVMWEVADRGAELCGNIDK